MVITYKQQFCELCHENVIMKHGIINLDLNDYRDCQKVGEEWFAVSVDGDTIEDAIKQLKNEISSYNIKDIKAVIIYLQDNSVDDLNKILAFSEWVDSLPDNIMVKWGFGIEGNTSTTPRLLMFTFN